ncbi:hypothetical protein GCM10028801_44790 [Nocardioides maradonensis]
MTSMADDVEEILAAHTPPTSFSLQHDPQSWCGCWHWQADEAAVRRHGYRELVRQHRRHLAEVLAEACFEAIASWTATIEDQLRREYGERAAARKAATVPPPAQPEAVLF